MVFEPFPGPRPTPTPLHSPAPIENVSSAVAISSDRAGFCALEADGTVSCWGEQLPVEGCSHRVAAVPAAVAPAEDVVAIRGGFGSACAIHAEGTVSCWGCASRSELGSTDGDASEIVDIATPIQVQGASGCVAFVAPTCVRTESDDVLCWGDDRTLGAIGPGAQEVAWLRGARSLASVEASDFSGVVVSYGDGLTRRFGFTPAGVAIEGEPLADLAGSIELSGGDPCALGHDARVRCWHGWAFTNGEPALGALPGLERVADLEVRGGSACAMTAEGATLCWGDVPHPELHRDDSLWVWPPVVVPGLD